MITYKQCKPVILLIFLLGISVGNAYSFQTRDTTTGPLHFIRSWSPKVPIKDASLLTRKNRYPNEVIQVTSYYDALGRQVQTVNRKFSPGSSDLVTVNEYDSVGHQVRSYLPYVSPSNDGGYKTNWLAEQGAANGTAYPNQSPYYGKTTYERSPLERIVKQSRPGTGWAGADRGVIKQFQFNNVSDSVRIWELNSSGSPVTTASYDQGELDKVIVTDENGQQSITYINRQGLVVLTKTQISANSGNGHIGWNCEYNVYDDFNRLRATISPLAVSKIVGSWNVTPVLNLCTLIKYDALGRIVVSKASDADSVEMVYDNRNRLVFRRDGNQRRRKEWEVNFYDEFDRLVIAAIYPSDSTRIQLQALMNAAADVLTSTSYTIPGIADLAVANYSSADQNYRASNSVTLLPGFESPSNADFTVYIDTAFTTSTETIIVNNTLPGIKGYIPFLYRYYDNYSYAGAKSFDPSYSTKVVANNDPYPDPITVSGLTNSLLTGQKVKVLGTEQWLTTSIFYDEKGRPIQTKADNITGGEDIFTNQYNFSGQVLSSYSHYSNKQSGTTPFTNLLTIFSYDSLGNITSVKHRLNDDIALERTVVVGSYNKEGLLVSKGIGKQANGTFLETLSYNYNVHGWLTGINTDYLANNNTSGKHFGLQLGYESGFVTPQYNGNLAGVKWKGWNDKTNRQYNFSYDLTNQLTGAAFTQQNAGSTAWTKDKVDYTVDNLTYDPNGNIKTIRQFGLLATQPGVVDDLVYSNVDNSNQLKYVYDKANNVASKYGDFKEPTTNNAANQSNGLADYNYDRNGNMIADANKGISIITYNSLNLPERISVFGKGVIQYLYSADGAKLRKLVVDSTVTPVRSIKTDYISGLVYVNDSLQYIPHSEGRIRPVYATSAPVKYVYDYFIKDHLQNTRLILTEQTDFSMYAATMESASAAKESILFSNIDNTRSVKPVGYPDDQRYAKNNFVSKLNAAENKKIGPSIVLKVMAGDTININVNAFYKSQEPKESEPAQTEQLLANMLLNTANSSPGNIGTHEVTVAEKGPFTTGLLSSDFQRLKDREDNQQSSYVKPQAYLSYALFDEQLSMVDDNSGVKQVKSEPDVLQTLGSDQMIMKKSGFLYVYTTNESPQDVFFDNLIITKGAGPVLDEMHYYPSGLLMDGISYKSYAAVDNRILFQGKERQSGEFNDGSGLEWYDFEARYYDPQLGRWFSPDPAGQDYSPYMAMGNRYVLVRDPDGRFWHIVIGALLGGTINLFNHIDQIHNLQDGLMAFGIGAAAGAIGAATGGAAIASLHIGASTLFGGMIAGAAFGSSSKFVEGVANAIYFGDPFKFNDVLVAGVQGAVIGGATGTIAGVAGGAKGYELVGLPKVNKFEISLSLFNQGKGIDPVYPKASKPIGSGGLGSGGSYTMPEYTEGNFHKPATTYNRDGSIIFGAEQAANSGAASEISTSAAQVTETAKSGMNVFVLTKHGELTNGVYTVSTEAMKKHIFNFGQGKSIFYSTLDANEAVLKAAQYADETGLWIGNKAKVPVLNTNIGTLGNGSPTNIINIYRNSNGFIHGSPGTIR